MATAVLGTLSVPPTLTVREPEALSDVEVCYKMFSSEVKETLALTCRDFGCEIQISAQIVRSKRWRIYEVNIDYYGRMHDVGKKISWKDGVKALFYLFKFRFD